MPYIDPTYLFKQHEQPLRSVHLNLAAAHTHMCELSFLQEGVPMEQRAATLRAFEALGAAQQALQGAIRETQRMCEAQRRAEQEADDRAAQLASALGHDTEGDDGAPIPQDWRDLVLQVKEALIDLEAFESRDTKSP